MEDTTESRAEREQGQLYRGTAVGVSGGVPSSWGELSLSLSLLFGGDVSLVCSDQPK